MFFSSHFFCKKSFFFFLQKSYPLLFSRSIFRQVFPIVFLQRHHAAQYCLVFLETKRVKVEEREKIFSPLLIIARGQPTATWSTSARYEEKTYTTTSEKKPNENGRRCRVQPTSCGQWSVFTSTEGISPTMFFRMCPYFFYSTNIFSTPEFSNDEYFSIPSFFSVLYFHLQHKILVSLEKSCEFEINLFSEFNKPFVARFDLLANKFFGFLL